MTPLARARWSLLRMAAREMRTARAGSASASRIFAQVAASAPPRQWHRRIAEKDERIAWSALERAARYVEQARAVGDAAEVLREVEHEYRELRTSCLACGQWVDRRGHTPECSLARLVGPR